jgi:hypothetical protein
MRADEFLAKAAEIMIERGRVYDTKNPTPLGNKLEKFAPPPLERSMRKTVDAFNVITGQDLTEAEGWLFMEVLKNVRLFTDQSKFHQDSAEDGIAYAALKAECMASQGEGIGEPKKTALKTV